MEAQKSIVEHRQLVHATRTALGTERENVRKLRQERREANNWLHGHQLPDETLKARGLLHTAQAKREEAESLQQQIGASEKRVAKLEAELSDLEAVRFGNDLVMEQALTDLRESTTSLRALRDKEASLKGEKKAATEALNQSNNRLHQAKSKKTKSLSLSEVSMTSKEEADAQREVDELEALLNNLGVALREIPSKLAAQEAAVKQAETTVWNAKCTAMLNSLAASPQFEQVLAGLQEAFAAWVRAGNTWLVERFLREVFVNNGGMEVESSQVTARQINIAKELGLENLPA